MKAFLFQLEQMGFKFKNCKSITSNKFIQQISEQLLACDEFDILSELLLISTMKRAKYSSINIVGGGCQDSYLNEMTAAATGLPVFAGPVEGTALGNLLCQMIQAGEYAHLAQARAAIRESFDILPV